MGSGESKKISVKMIGSCRYLLIGLKYLEEAGERGGSGGSKNI